MCQNRHRLCEDGEVSPRRAGCHDVTTVDRLRRQRRCKLLHLVGEKQVFFDLRHRPGVYFVRIVHTDYNEYTSKLID